MDYWEGLLLGPFWTDSDVRPASKRTAAFTTSLILLLLFFTLLLLPRFQDKVLPLSGGTALGLGLVLFFVAPVAAAFYYRVPAIVRPFILLLYFIAYILIFMGMERVALAQVDLDVATLPEMIVEFANLRMEETQRFFQFIDGIQGTIVAIVGGVIYIGILWIGSFLLALLGIALIIFGLVFLQRLWDRALMHLLYREV